MDFTDLRGPLLAQPPTVDDCDALSLYVLVATAVTTSYDESLISPALGTRRPDPGSESDRAGSKTLAA
jgi:hypothetical protein